MSGAFFKAEAALLETLRPKICKSSKSLFNTSSLLDGLIKPLDVQSHSDKHCDSILGNLSAGLQEIDESTTDDADIGLRKGMNPLFSTTTDEIAKLLPRVILEIEKSGLEPSFLLDFCKEVVEGKFHLDNISFLLWIEDQCLRREKSIYALVPKDHSFDMVDRQKRKGKMKEGIISRDWTAIHRGTLGVRWEKARVNQSKLLPTKRMGLPD